MRQPYGAQSRQRTLEEALILSDIGLSAPAPFPTNARWQQIAPILPPPKHHGRPAVDSYPHPAGILWIMRTGASWREMLAQFGHWHTAYARYQDWQRSGLVPQILAILQAPDTGNDL